MGLLSFLGFGKTAVKDALRKGAIIIDVRNVNEYDQGRVPESINIPINMVASSTERIKGMKRPVVFCSSSGSRSSKAVSIMKANGMKEVYNGGSWVQVLKMLKSL
jgi:rhodanese-related sulfurtransferase